MITYFLFCVIAGILAYNIAPIDKYEMGIMWAILWPVFTVIITVIVIRGTIKGS